MIIHIDSPNDELCKHLISRLIVSTGKKKCLSTYPLFCDHELIVAKDIAIPEDESLGDLTDCAIVFWRDKELTGLGPSRKVQLVLGWLCVVYRIRSIDVYLVYERNERSGTYDLDKRFRRMTTHLVSGLYEGSLVGSGGKPNYVGASIEDRRDGSIKVFRTLKYETCE